MLVREILEEAILGLDSDIGILPALKFFNARYQALASRVRLRHLRRVGEVTIPVNITAGTITLTSGSPDVVADATALAAWQNVGGVAGRFLQIRTSWHEILADTPTGCKLVAPFNETTVAGQGYTLVQRYVKLDPLAVWLGPFAIPKQNRMLFTTGQQEIDMKAPGRCVRDGGPWVVLQAPPDPVDGSLRVEFYPSVGSDQAELARYMYWGRPAKLGIDSPMPAGLAPQSMKEGILIDLMRREWAAALHAGNPEIAGHWRNTFEAQRTRWERDDVNIAGDVDNAVPDDSAILLLGSEHGMYGDFDPVSTAYDDVRVRWEGFN